MDIKEWILPFVFAIGMTYAVQYFLEPKSDQNLSGVAIKSGSGFTAPMIEDINKPLNLSIQLRVEQEQPVLLETVKTVCGTYVFSNKGAILQSFSFPWQKGAEIIDTIAPTDNCFFIAFENNSPVMYRLDKILGDEKTDKILIYKAHFDGGLITKTFTIHHDSYAIDLEVLVAYDDHKVENPVQLRLVIPQPVMQPVVAWDKVTGFINENKGLKTIDVTKKDAFQQFWALPSCFGYESRFLIHAFVKDETNLVQRAYMVKDRLGSVSGLLESKLFAESASWKTQFFVGPKTSQAIVKVDDRLLKTLNFGWLSPISHAMLLFLNYLYEQIGNYGWAIILLTLLLKLLLLPFTMYGEKNMRKGAEMQQKLAYLQKKYKDNPEVFNQQREELIKKHGVPGLAGCLPLLLTLPILIGLNTVLSNAIELYGAPFLWIENLYAVDPYYILPVLTGFAMLATPMDSDPKKGLMRYAMALMMATIACYLSAGLVLFILINSLTAALQAQLQKR